MAKTNFQNGTIVTSTYLNTIFGQGAGGGHVHDADDNDGHCAKINPQNHIDATLYAINVDVTSTYFSTPVNADWYYWKVGPLIIILIPDMVGTHSSNAQLQFTPNSGNWPSIMIPTTAQLLGGVYFSKQDPSLAELRLGALQIPSVSSSNIIASICDDTAELQQGGFGTGGGQPKGILRQTISYIVD